MPYAKGAKPLVFLDGEDDLLRGFVMAGPDDQKDAPHGWVRLTR